MDVSLFSSCSHVTIKTRNVDPRAEGGARILIKESSIKAIEKCRDESSLEKSSTDISPLVWRGSKVNRKSHKVVTMYLSEVDHW